MTEPRITFTLQRWIMRHRGKGCSPIRVGYIDDAGNEAAMRWRIRFTPAAGQPSEDGPPLWFFLLKDAKAAAVKILRG